MLGFFYYHFDATGEARFPSGEGPFTMVVGSMPERKDAYQSFEGEVVGSGVRASVRAALYPRLYYGDEVTVYGSAKEEGGKYILFSDSVSVTGAGKGNRIMDMLYRVRSHADRVINAAFAGEHAALVSGVLLGERAQFSPELKEALVKSGTIHIVALSGYNILVVISFAVGACILFLPRRKALILALLAVCGFVLMTGAALSAVRAGIMGGLMILAEAKGRMYAPRNAITVTAAGMLLWDPSFIADVGFLLSFAALLGIVYGVPLLRSFLHLSREWTQDGWRKSALETFAAELAVLPISFFYFGTFSYTAFFANMLILPVIPATMFLSALTVVAGIFSYHLALLPASVTSIFLSYEVMVIRLFGSHLF